MLQEDQRVGESYYDETDQYYDEEDLPDEHQQIEIIRRMRHNQVASESNQALQKLADLQVK